MNAPSGAGPVPVYFLHVEDFEWWFTMLDSTASIAEAAREMARHAVGARVRDRGLPLKVTLIDDTGSENGVVLDPEARVGDVIIPQSLLKLDWVLPRQGSRADE